MARRSKKSTDPQTPTFLAIRPTIEPVEDGPAYYVNFAEIAISTNEFTMLAARVPTKLSAQRLQEAKAQGTLTFNAEVQLIMPPTLIPGLIRALTVSKEQYEKQAGAPIVDPSAPRDEKHAR
jgi:hypothetical protein